MNQTKVTYASKVRDTATQFAKLVQTASEIVTVWDDRLYGPGAANEITDADLAVGPGAPGNIDGLVASPDDLYAMIIALSQFAKFVGGDASAVPGDYINTFNKLRQDM